MQNTARKLAKEWLASKKVDAIYGLREQYGDIAPYLFSEEKDLDNLVIPSKYRAAHVCRPSKKNIINLILEKEPKLRLGVVGRGCDERALIELAKRNQIDLDRIEILGINCTAEEARECGCDRPYSKHAVIGEKASGVEKDKAVEELLEKSLAERAAFWNYQLSKCIKCYGCRNACPQCFCKDCKMEEKLWAKTGKLPVESPIFHFIRFYHLADRCTGCGACERACPMDIPLLTILKLMKKDIKELFDYESGIDVNEKSPLLTTLDEPPSKEKHDVKV